MTFLCDSLRNYVNFQPSMEFYTGKDKWHSAAKPSIFAKGAKLKSKYNKVLKEKNYFINWL